MTTPQRPVVGLVTIGQSPRPDVVPDMAEITGPGVEIREAGALDGLGRAEIDALVSWPGRLGVVVPSVPHVPQAVERWRGEGFDPVVVALSPYEEEDPAAVTRAADGIRGVGLVVMDCMGFRRKTRDEMRELTGAPVLLANLLVARVIAELCGG